MQLEFELAYFEATVQHFNHYAKGTPYAQLYIVQNISTHTF